MESSVKITVKILIMTGEMIIGLLRTGRSKVNMKTLNIRSYLGNQQVSVKVGG